MIRPEERQAFREQLRSEPHFRFVATPLDFIEERLPQSDLKERISESRVLYFGESFPLVHWDEHAIQVCDNYVEGLYKGNELRSAYRFYRSGQFVHLERLNEELPEAKVVLERGLEISGEQKEDLDGYLDYVWTVHRFVQYLSFLDRLATKCGIEESWNVSISLESPGVRAVSVSQPSRSIWALYFTPNKPIAVKTLIAYESLRNTPGEEVIDLIVEFFSKFSFKFERHNVEEVILQFMQGLR